MDGSVKKGISALASALIIVGCSSSGSSGSKATIAAPQQTTGGAAITQPGAVNATTPSGSGSGADVALPVQDAQYSNGRIHVEFGGDSGGAVEINGTGAVIGGFANLAFSDDAAKSAAVFAIGGGEPGGATFTWDGTTSGGEFGKECSISFTKGDATTLEGSFTCTGMHGVKATSTDDQRVDAHGTFTLSA